MLNLGARIGKATAWHGMARQEKAVVVSSVDKGGCTRDHNRRCWSFIRKPGGPLNPPPSKSRYLFGQWSLGTPDQTTVVTANFVLWRRVCNP